MLGGSKSLVKFGGQTSKNVRDVRKVCLETCLCALVCFVKFYVIVLDKIDVRDSLYMYDYIEV